MSILIRLKGFLLPSHFNYILMLSVQDYPNAILQHYIKWIGFKMKVCSSLKSAKQRSSDCQIVKRRGKLYVICKSNPLFKARQG